MNKNVFYNRKFAVTFVIIVAVLSVLLGGARGLNALRDNAVDVFEGRTPGARFHSLVDNIGGLFTSGKADAYYSLGKKINDRVSSAETIIAIAENRLPGDNDIKDLKNAVSILKRTSDINEKIKYNDIMTASFSKIKDKVNIGANDGDYSRWTIACNDMISHKGTMDGNCADYNKLAEDFNKRLSGFPANIIRLLGLTEKLPVYGISN